MIFLVVGSLFTPGNFLIDPVDQTDFAESVSALADNSFLTHLMTLVLIFGVLLEAFGVMPFFRLTGGQRTVAGMVLRTGLIGMLFCWGVYALQLATNHMVVHIMTHGIGGGTGPEVQAQLQELAQTIYAVGGALHIGFLAISCVASILLGLGLASRFSAMNPFKAAAYGLVFIGVLLLLNLIIIQHIHNVNISVILLISSGALFLGTVCYFVLGIGLYQGRRELLPDES